ncbi:unnamed protein product [Caenorhabditis auriculariae]|uniref:C2H2-type domain-containing protein n=1 Tax=Caenorhabditis auriculariae TaxID=2777116 RepID=A0A8S1HX55_9PELO|nr:unnamed protein product [Caenorhabditis auriculariae]
MTSHEGSSRYLVKDSSNLKELYRCPDCGKTFTCIPLLCKHQDIVHKQEHFCKICNKAISEKQTVNVHMVVTHDLTNAITCACCSWTFPDRHEMNEHMNSLSRNGHPGISIVIATSRHKPGSLRLPEKPSIKLKSENINPEKQKKEAIVTPVQIKATKIHTLSPSLLTVTESILWDTIKSAKNT